MTEIKRTNPKALETIALRLKELNGVQGKVGWFESSRYENGTPVAYVAAIQELGYAGGNIPPRPFFRPTALKEADKWKRLALQASKAALSGTGSGEALMELITVQAEGDVSKTISEIFTPPLSPITIELRDMKRKNPNIVITAKTVGEAARRVSQPGYVTPSVSTKPLNDSGHMIATLTHIVEKIS